MRVALGQLDMIWEDKEKSFQRLRGMVADAARQNADIIVFPEMSLTGFSMNLDKIAEDADSSDTKSKMKHLARECRIAVGYGWAALPERGAQKATNRFTLIDRAGEQVAEYSKLHPFSYGGESEVFQGGDEIVSVPFLGRNISLFICYDLRFPEIFQAAARSSDILFVIANWPEIRRDHWKTLIRARAIETQSYVVGVNCFGERDKMIYSGDSLVCDAIGNILGELPNQEGVLVCDLDDRAWSLRQKFNTAADRRIDFYQRIMK